MAAKTPPPRRPVGRALALWLSLLLALPVVAASGEGGAAPTLTGSLVHVDGQLECSGQRIFSTRRLRARLGAGGTVDTASWRGKLDSLALAYAERGHPLLAVEVLELAPDRDGPRLLALRLDEGPRLVFGEIRVRGHEGLLLPDPARDLPPGRTATAASLAEGLDAWLRRLEAEGRPLSRLRLRDVEVWPDENDPGLLRLDLDYDLDRTGEWRPLEIRLEGLRTARPEAVRRLARLEAGQLHDPRRLKEARRRLLASGWFEQVEGPLLAQGAQGPALLLRLEEAPSYRFDALAGLLPPRGDETTGRLSFHLQLDFDNLLGTGRELHLLASRPDGISQRLDVGYREPFLFGWPLGASAELEQRLQDSSWVELGVSGGLDWEPLPGLLLGAGAGLRELNPDSLNGWVARGVERSVSRLTRLSLSFDGRDDPRNPRQGWSATLGSEWQNRRPQPYRGLPPLSVARTLLRRRAELKLWWPLSSRWVLHPALKVGQVSAGAPVEERLTLGGGAGPRGLREDEIRAEDYGLFQLELRYLLGPAARVALFGDWARFGADGTRGSRRGLGAGLVLPTRLGQVELQYAVADDRTWEEGLIHVRLIARF